MILFFPESLTTYLLQKVSQADKKWQTAGRYKLGSSPVPVLSETPFRGCLVLTWPQRLSWVGADAGYATCKAVQSVRTQNTILGWLKVFVLVHRANPSKSVDLLEPARCLTFLCYTAMPFSI